MLNEKIKTMTNENYIMGLSIDVSDPYSIDSNIDSLLSDPRIKNRLYERLRYNISSPGKAFYESLDQLIDDGIFSNDLTPLLRRIHQLDIEVSYLSHQLVNYDSFINKYDKLAVKVDFLKRQNKRLSNRNQELIRDLHSSKNNR